MSPRHCGELGLRLKSWWAVDIHDLLAFFISVCWVMSNPPMLADLVGHEQRDLAGNR
jgi:hypothetical protein